jgi:preprotein translocase subunit YajC
MAIEAITFIALVLLIIIFLGRIALSEGRRAEERKKLRENLKKFDDERNR